MSVPVPMYGFGGGGGTSLNFDVKAYATEEALLAATPKENTIGIITTNKITGWLFSATEPESPTEGMVWISTGASSTIEFNALKKNGIQVYPLSAKQYVSGAWVDVTAMSYQGGEWVEWIKAGDIYINGKIHPDYSYDIFSYDSGADITNQSLIGLNTHYGWIYITPKVDLTNFSTLKMTAGGFTRLGVFSAAVDVPPVVGTDGNTVYEETTKTYDVLALTGSYYIMAYRWTESSAKGNLYMKEIILE